MADINKEALASLTSTLKALLPPAAPAPTLVATPLRIMTAGLGGYVGPHDDPPGDILARRVEALVTVTISANNLAALNDRLSEVLGATVAADRGVLRERGVLNLTLDGITPQPPEKPANQVKTRDLTFKVFYEHLQKPEAGEGIISQIPINLTAG